MPARSLGCNAERYNTHPVAGLDPATHAFRCVCNSECLGVDARIKSGQGVCVTNAPSEHDGAELYKR
jgi:hypothetical protein